MSVQPSVTAEVADDLEGLLSPGHEAPRFNWWRTTALVATSAVGLLAIVSLQSALAPAPIAVESPGGLTVLTEVVADDPDDFDKDMDLGIPIYTDQKKLGAASKEPKHWLINLPEDSTPDHIKEVADRFGDKVVDSGKSLPFIIVEGTLREVKDMLDGNTDDIEMVEQDSASSTIPEMPEDRRLRQTNPPSWGIDRVDQHDLPLSRSFDPEGGAGVHVYVFDTGINVNHRDFGGRAIPTLEILGNNGRACGGRTNCAEDRNGHGTHCAGTIGGRTFGVAKQAVLHGVKILSDSGSGAFSWMERALDWVVSNGPKPAVVSASLGGQGRLRSMERAIDETTRNGVTVVIAAGNQNADACGFTPAYVHSAITVGSTTSRDGRSSFSNFGSCLDLYAPGSAIVSASHQGSSGSATLSGTSMACPHVSGAAALLLGGNPSLKPERLDQILKAYSSKGLVSDPGEASPNMLLRTGEVATTEPPPHSEHPDAATCSSHGWRVQSGNCNIDSECCLRSPNFPRRYDNDDGCTISVGSKPGKITVKRFNTEDGFDFLKIPTFSGDHQFHSREGPEGYIPTGTIEWKSDYSVTKSGFKLCLENIG